MGIFTPATLCGRVTDITPAALRGLGAQAVLLDVDNTVAAYTSHQPLPGAIAWAQGLVQAGFKVVIVSNNYKKRVSAFAARFGLPCISFALKPLPFGYLRAARLLKVPPRRCVVIGDQIFTDVLGANLCGMRSVLLTPLEPEEGFTFRVRRYLERGLRQRFSAEFHDAGHGNRDRMKG
ncbi:YqeG family HAD IIIA-type phosphatase [Acutalibacter caecimuris]|uniref:YqeG family HAD IIIA-type phosphatase n=1 Tax=Acutalibacter caecimuris TaxID=3093657 RepID=UPI002AC99034|nr:YqeG family HAD IIIA-type phosphatase [Acutalibacter sp. M00118]